MSPYFDDGYLHWEWDPVAGRWSIKWLDEAFRKETKQ